MDIMDFIAMDFENMLADGLEGGDTNGFVDDVADEDVDGIFLSEADQLVLRDDYEDIMPVSHHSSAPPPDTILSPTGDSKRAEAEADTPPPNVEKEEAKQDINTQPGTRTLDSPGGPDPFLSEIFDKGLCDKEQFDRAAQRFGAKKTRMIMRWRLVRAKHLEKRGQPLCHV